MPFSHHFHTVFMLFYAVFMLKVMVALASILAVLHSGGNGSAPAENITITYTQTVTAEVVFPAAAAVAILLPGSPEGVQFKAGVAATAGVEPSKVSITTGADAGRRQLQGNASGVSVRFTIEADEDISHILTDAAFVSDLVTAVHAAAIGNSSLLSGLNSTLVTVDESSFSYVTEVEYTLQSTADAVVDVVNVAQTMTDNFATVLAAATNATFTHTVDVDTDPNSDRVVLEPTGEEEMEAEDLEEPPIEVRFYNRNDDFVLPESSFCIEESSFHIKLHS